MPSIQSERPGISKPWHGKAWIHLLAAVTGVLPLYSSLVIYQLRRDQRISVQGFIFYPRFGRAVPLILAHYATNALQVVVVAVLVR